MILTVRKIRAIRCSRNILQFLRVLRGRKYRSFYNLCSPPTRPLKGAFIRGKKNFRLRIHPHPGPPLRHRRTSIKLARLRREEEGEKEGLLCFVPSNLLLSFTLCETNPRSSALVCVPFPFRARFSWFLFYSL
jgi:hypothetical protein